MKYLPRALLALFCAVLVGCSGSVPGQAFGQAYLPIDPQALELQPIYPQLSERVLGLSPDGVTMIVDSARNGICAIQITAKEEASGTATAIQLPGGPVGPGSGFVALFWNRQRDEIIGTSHQLAADGSRVRNVVAIDPEAATAQVIGEKY